MDLKSSVPVDEEKHLAVCSPFHELLPSSQSKESGEEGNEAKKQIAIFARLHKLFALTWEDVHRQPSFQSEESDEEEIDEEEIDEEESDEEESDEEDADGKSNEAGTVGGDRAEDIELSREGV